MKKGLISLILIALVAGGVGVYWKYFKSSTGVKIAYRTAEVTQGQVRSEIRSTGTIEPEDLIDVGAQVTGQILAFGTDDQGHEVDYCSRVKKGQLLARIDDVTYKAEVTKSQAALATAEANVASAKANIDQLKAKLNQAARDWSRAQKLGVGDALSQKDFDAYASANEVAVANVAVGEASLAQAQAAVASSKADLEKAERNLSYCDILATVDGTIIDRRVNIGQTVTASMSTPSLFLVAKDLRKVQIWVPVNEADIGSITLGQRVLFTVDAFAGQVFEGHVSRIRLNAAMSSNVVTYTVEVDTTNEDGKLLPYLTANVSFILAESAPNSVIVPAATLAWTPEGWERPATMTEKDGVVFIQDPSTGSPRAIVVTPGVTDESSTAILNPPAELQAGDSLIVGVMSATEIAAVQQSGANPFLPKGPKWRKPPARP